MPVVDWAARNGMADLPLSVETADVALVLPAREHQAEPDLT